MVNYIKICAFLFLFSLNSNETQAQKKVKDTLFFKIDNTYLFERDYIPKTFFLEDGNHSTELCFIESEILHNLKPKKVLYLKYFIRNSKFYINDGKAALDINGLMDFMKNYKIILVREKDNGTDFIKVNNAIMTFD